MGFAGGTLEPGAPEVTSSGEEMLWGGRFASGPHPEMVELTSSLDIDVSLLEQDVAVTRAHARGLVAAGLLEEEALASIDAACDQLLEDAASGALEIRPTDEDIHTVVERFLTERLGDVGRNIHAGRSRNDLIATDLRLWCRETADALSSEIAELVATICDVASEHVDTMMPGYTHLQRAQPITLGFHLCAHGFALCRDIRRFASARHAADVSSLGAGALAGTTLPIDPSIAAGELDFADTFDNALDSVSDRDFVVDLVYACSMLAVHLSRFAEEVVLWTTSEFAFARLSDDWSTGSSMMPQKRNPDLAELLRGRSGGAIGDLVSLLALLKSLPLAYNRDLQEDKSHLFRAVSAAGRGVRSAGHLVKAMTFDAERLEEATRRGASWATDVAEWLVLRGIAFRDAHKAVGTLVARLEREGLDLQEASEELLTSCHPALTVEVRVLAEPRRAVSARANPGGPAPDRVREQIETLRTVGSTFSG